MNDIVNILAQQGYEVKSLLSSGSHGDCFFVREGNISYILKVYKANEERECLRETQVYNELHENGLGKDWLFKGTHISFAGKHCLRLDTYEGQTLESYFCQADLSIEDKFNVLIKACETIAKMHKSNPGYLHLDIKPSNFYVSKDGQYVKPIDLGSAVKITPKKDFAWIMSDLGYMSTDEYASRKLRKFNQLRREYRNYEIIESDKIAYLLSEEEKNSLVNIEKTINTRDDIYSLICCVFYVFSGGKHFGFWLANDNVEYDHETEIRNVLMQNNIPIYLLEEFVQLFMTLIKPYQDEWEEVPFATVEELIEKLEDIRQTETNDGITAGIILRNAIRYNKAHFADLVIEEDLLCDIGAVKEMPIAAMNLAEYILSDLKKQNIYLICEGGAGKTYQLIFAYQQLLEKGNKAIPIYIPLNQYNGEDTNYIQNYIIKHYTGKPEKDADESNRNMLKTVIEESAYSFFIFIDALNETSVFPDRAYAEIENISKWRNTRLVVTSRTDCEYLSDFLRFKLNKLDDEYIEKKLCNYKNMRKALRELIRLPFYFKRFVDIPDAQQKRVTGAADLLEMYHEWLIRKAGKSLDSVRYVDFCSALLHDFLPEFAYHQMKKASYLSFERKECVQMWKSFKEDNDITFNKECIKTLEEFGIIRKVEDKKYAFAHQNGYTYFVSKYIFDMIAKNQKQGDELLVDVGDEYVLNMVGELMGEHKFADKDTLDGDEKSPVELALDAYRSTFDDKTARIVAKYIDIMKRCRQNHCTADFSGLDLRKTNLYGKFAACFVQSDFNNSRLSWTSFEPPAFDSMIQFVYGNEKNKYVITSDLKSKIIVLNERLEIYNQLSLTPAMELENEQVNIKIYTAQIFVTISGTSLETREYYEETNSCDLYCKENGGLLLAIENGKVTYTDSTKVHVMDNPINDTLRKAGKAVQVMMFATALKNWIFNTNGRQLVMENANKHRHTVALFHNFESGSYELNAYSKECGFSFSDGVTYPGDLYVEKQREGRVYNTRTKRCEFFHERADTNLHREQIDDEIFVERYPFMVFNEEEHAYVVAFNSEHGYRSKMHIKVPITGKKMAIKPCGDVLLVYTGKQIALGRSDDKSYEQKPEYLYPILNMPFKKINLHINGEILYNGCRIFNDILYVLYVSGAQSDKGWIKLVQYDCVHDKIINHISTNIYMGNIDFEQSAYVDNYKKPICNIAVKSDRIYIRHQNRLIIYFIKYNWHVSISLYEAGIKNVSRILPYNEGIFLFQSDNRIIKLNVKQLITDEAFYEKETWGEGKFTAGTWEIRKMRGHEGIFKDQVAGESCMAVVQECAIQYLQNIDIRGCTFDGAKMVDARGHAKFVPEEILFNT